MEQEITKVLNTQRIMEASEKTTKIETNQGDEIPSNSF